MAATLCQRRCAQCDLVPLLLRDPTSSHTWRHCHSSEFSSSEYWIQRLASVSSAAYLTTMETGAPRCTWLSSRMGDMSGIEGARRGTVTKGGFCTPGTRLAPLKNFSMPELRWCMHLCPCVLVFVSVRGHACVHVCISVCAYMCVLVCVHVCMYVHAHTHASACV